MSTIISFLRDLAETIAIGFCLLIVFAPFALAAMVEDGEKQDAERKRQMDENERQRVAEVERVTRETQWKRDAPLREAQQREQRERAEAERRERSLRRLEVAKADVAGEDVCWDCLTINPYRCSNDGACTDGCSHSCPSDD